MRGVETKIGKKKGEGRRREGCKEKGEDGRHREGESRRFDGGSEDRGEDERRKRVERESVRGR